MVITISYKTCECGRQFTDEDSSGDLCFPCKLKGVKFSFVGGGSYGRQAFKGETNSEIARRTVAEGKAKGFDLEPIPQRAELI